MFDSKMQYTPVAKLSGGERRRLGLMMVLIKNPNFLILDEPTNDLDILTLEKLESFLADYGGCLIIVSHDRYFMDNLVDQFFVFEGSGKIRTVFGNYSDYKALKEKEEAEAEEQKAAQKQKSTAASGSQKSDNSEKLSYNERREYNKLEKEIEKLEQQKDAISAEMNSGITDYEKLQELSEQFNTVKDELEEKELRWLELAERA